MRLDRAIVIGLAAALLCVVAFAALRVPRSSHPLHPGGKGRARAARTGPLPGDIDQLERAASAIEAEFDRLADHVLFAGSGVSPGSAKKRAHHHAAAFTQRTKGTIFVGLASYQDPMCRDTVDSLFSRAANPLKVHIAVVEQHTPDVRSCYPPHLDQCQLKDNCLSDNLRIRRVPTKDSRGHAFGRYAAMLMYHGEEFVLIGRSNQVFAPRWDALLLAEHETLRASVAKPIITQRPVLRKTVDEANTTLTGAGPVTVLCSATFVANVAVPDLAGVIVQPRPPAPLLMPWASTELMFANASLLRDVPNDPHLAYMEQGDDVLFSTRLWTHGWDMYAPTTDIAATVESPSDITFKKDHGESAHIGATQSFERVQYLVEAKKEGSNENAIDDATTATHVIIEADVYGMGDVRPLDEFWHFAAIDMKQRKVLKNWCPGAARG